MGILLYFQAFGFLDNFGINGGKNGFIEIEGITKYDTVFTNIVEYGSHGFSLCSKIVESVYNFNTENLNQLRFFQFFFCLLLLR